MIKIFMSSKLFVWHLFRSSVSKAQEKERQLLLEKLSRDWLENDQRVERH